MSQRLEPLPYYKWLWRDFRASRKVQRMDYIERGLYRELLDECWAEGCIPDSVEDLADICGCPIDVMANAWQKLSKCFEKVDGRLVNEKLDSLRTESDEKRVKLAMAGKSGAIAKKQITEIDNDSSKSQANAKQMPDKCHIAEQSRAEQKQNIKHSPDDLSVADMMKSKIELLVPKMKPPDLAKWANSIRLMRESDGRDIATIKQVFLWANRHSFWAANILSPGKLREKFDHLTAQMGRELQNGQAGQSGGFAPQQDNSAAGRVRAEVARSRAARAAAAGGDGMAVADDVVNVRPQMGEQLRPTSGSGPGMGVVLEGDFQRSD